MHKRFSHRPFSAHEARLLAMSPINYGANPNGPQMNPSVQAEGYAARLTVLREQLIKQRARLNMTYDYQSQPGEVRQQICEELLNHEWTDFQQRWNGLAAQGNIPAMQREWQLARQSLIALAVRGWPQMMLQIDPMGGVMFGPGDAQSMSPTPPINQQPQFAMNGPPQGMAFTQSMQVPPQGMQVPPQMGGMGPGAPMGPPGRGMQPQGMFPGQPMGPAMQPGMQPPMMPPGAQFPPGFNPQMGPGNMPPFGPQGFPGMPGQPGFNPQMGPGFQPPMQPPNAPAISPERMKAFVQTLQTNGFSEAEIKQLLEQLRQLPPTFAQPFLNLPPNTQVAIERVVLRMLQAGVYRTLLEAMEMVDGPGFTTLVLNRPNADGLTPAQRTLWEFLRTLSDAEKNALVQLHQVIWEIVTRQMMAPPVMPPNAPGMSPYNNPNLLPGTQTESPQELQRMQEQIVKVLTELGMTAQDQELQVLYSFRNAPSTMRRVMLRYFNDIPADLRPQLRAVLPRLYHAFGATIYSVDFLFQNLSRDGHGGELIRLLNTDFGIGVLPSDSEYLQKLGISRTSRLASFLDTFRDPAERRAIARFVEHANTVFGSPVPAPTPGPGNRPPTLPPDFDTPPNRPPETVDASFEDLEKAAAELNVRADRVATVRVTNRSSGTIRRVDLGATIVGENREAVIAAIRNGLPGGVSVDVHPTENRIDVRGIDNNDARSVISRLRVASLNQANEQAMKRIEEALLKAGLTQDQIDAIRARLSRLGGGVSSSIADAIIKFSLIPGITIDGLLKLIPGLAPSGPPENPEFTALRKLETELNAIRPQFAQVTVENVAPNRVRLTVTAPGANRDALRLLPLLARAPVTELSDGRVQFGPDNFDYEHASELIGRLRVEAERRAKQINEKEEAAESLKQRIELLRGIQGMMLGRYECTGYDFRIDANNDLEVRLPAVGSAREVRIYSLLRSRQGGGIRYTLTHRASGETVTVAEGNARGLLTPTIVQGMVDALAAGPIRNLGLRLRGATPPEPDTKQNAEKKREAERKQAEERWNTFRETAEKLNGVTLNAEGRPRSQADTLAAIRAERTHLAGHRDLPRPATLALPLPDERFMGERWVKMRVDELNKEEARIQKESAEASEWQRRALSTVSDIVQLRYDSGPSNLPTGHQFQVLPDGSLLVRRPNGMPGAIRETRTFTLSRQEQGGQYVYQLRVGGQELRGATAIQQAVNAAAMSPANVQALADLIARNLELRQRSPNAFSDLLRFPTSAGNIALTNAFNALSPEQQKDVIATLGGIEQANSGDQTRVFLLLRRNGEAFRTNANHPLRLFAGMSDAQIQAAFRRDGITMNALPTALSEFLEDERDITPGQKTALQRNALPVARVLRLLGAAPLAQPPNPPEEQEKKEQAEAKEKMGQQPDTAVILLHNAGSPLDSYGDVYREFALGLPPASANRRIAIGMVQTAQHNNLLPLGSRDPRTVRNVGNIGPANPSSTFQQMDGDSTWSDIARSFTTENPPRPRRVVLVIRGDNGPMRGEMNAETVARAVKLAAEQNITQVSVVLLPSGLTTERARKEEARAAEEWRTFCTAAGGGTVAVIPPGPQTNTAFLDRLHALSHGQPAMTRAPAMTADFVAITDAARPFTEDHRKTILAAANAETFEAQRNRPSALYTSVTAALGGGPNSFTHLHRFSSDNVVEIVAYEGGFEQGRIVIRNGTLERYVNTRSTLGVELERQRKEKQQAESKNKAEPNLETFRKTFADLMARTNASVPPRTSTSNHLYAALESELKTIQVELQFLRDSGSRIRTSHTEYAPQIDQRIRELERMQVYRDQYRSRYNGEGELLANQNDLAIEIGNRFEKTTAERRTRFLANQNNPAAIVDYRSALLVERLILGQSKNFLSLQSMMLQGANSESRTTAEQRTANTVIIKQIQERVKPIAARLQSIDKELAPLPREMSAFLLAPEPRGIHRIGGPTAVEQAWIDRIIQNAETAVKSNESNDQEELNDLLESRRDVLMANYVPASSGGISYRTDGSDRYRFLANGVIWQILPCVSDSIINAADSLVMRSKDNPNAQAIFRTSDIFNTTTRQINFEGVQKTIKLAEMNRQSGEKDLAGVGRFDIARGRPVGVLGLYNTGDHMGTAYMRNMPRMLNAQGAYDLRANGEYIHGVNEPPLNIITREFQPLYAQGVRDFFIMLVPHGLAPYRLRPDGTREVLETRSMRFRSPDGRTDLTLTPADILSLRQRFAGSTITLDIGACRSGGVAQEPLSSFGINANEPVPTGEANRGEINIFSQVSSIDNQYRYAGRDVVDENEGSTLYNALLLRNLATGMQYGQAHLAARTALNRIRPGSIPRFRRTADGDEGLETVRTENPGRPDVG